MTKLVLRIYDFFRMHRMVGILSFVVLSLVLVVQVMRLDYVEDISDFLPLSGRHQSAMRVYQDISGANRLFVVFQSADSTNADPDQMVAVMDAFAEAVGDTSLLTTQVNLEQMTELTDFVYSHIPYFLSDADYARMDSVLSTPGFVRRQLQEDKQMLMFPAGSLLSENIRRDPLNLFTPVVQQLQRYGGSMEYELYDGHIFTPDMSRAIAMMNSPYGSSETENNARLLARLQHLADSVGAASSLSARIVGGPAVAVGNASQIKKDSVLSVSIAVVLILLLLFFAFRNVRNILLIAVSIAWGWLFALGGLALVHDHISVIVIGISSVILGIAVNYPLHLIAHLSHTPSMKSALREIIMPLVVGNITTVGAFLALIPLRSVALRDLGLFSSFLLVGTILFVILYLPHVAKKTKHRPASAYREGENNSEASQTPLVGNRFGHGWAFLLIAVLTVVFAWFSTRTAFDANMSHINYMTDEQKSDMAYFQQFVSPASDNEQTVYVVSEDQTLEGALDKSLGLQPALSQLQQQGAVNSLRGCSQFLVSRWEQQRRLELWDAFLARWGEKLRSELPQAASAEGFSADSFADFWHTLSVRCQPLSVEQLSAPFADVFSGHLSADSAQGRPVHSVVDVLSVPRHQVDGVEQTVDGLQPSVYSFDAEHLNSAIARNLSDDFNYIGWACGLIVFLFLWFSLGSFELAALSFLPMAVSWVWILGIMGLLGIQFNIVNVILATFIFGQGDDYTIFMTEGCQYEYAYRRKILSHYKQSIMLSALIMFIGIGSLILARHPALRSLAQVTIVGMSSVVLMAWLLPPFIFRWLTMKNGRYRERPLSIHGLWLRLRGQASTSDTPVTTPEQARQLVMDRYRYKGVETVMAVRRRLHDRQMLDEAVRYARQQEIVLHADDHGEQALLVALLAPQSKVTVCLPDEERRLLLRYAAEGVAPNLVVSS